MSRLPPQRQQRDVWGGVGLGIALLLCLAHIPGGVSCFNSRGAEGPVTTDLRLQLDPNVATAEEMMLLPDIGPVLAAAIVDYRESCTTQPAFAAADDLRAVRGLGPKRVAGMRPYLRFLPVSEPSPETAP